VETVPGLILTSPEILGAVGRAGVGGIAKECPADGAVSARGERYKRMRCLSRWPEQLAEAGRDRDALLVAFGGGVCGDMTGFSRATTCAVCVCAGADDVCWRGRLIVGGKTDRTWPRQEPIGSFHHPLAVCGTRCAAHAARGGSLRVAFRSQVEAGVIRDARPVAVSREERPMQCSPEA